MNWYKKYLHTAQDHTQMVPEDREQFYSTNIADVQRGVPEQAMLVVQSLMGGGVLNPVVEHTGDLIHRMSERNTWESGGIEAVSEKVDKVLYALTYDYGFEKEMEENIRSNAKYQEVDEDKLRMGIYQALENYAKAHEQIPVYNTAQELARGAAIDVGRRNWDGAINKLKTLQNFLNEGFDSWVQRVHSAFGDRLGETESVVEEIESPPQDEDELHTDLQRSI